jgi:hypothetical protein
VSVVLDLPSHLITLNKRNTFSADPGLDGGRTSSRSVSDDKTFPLSEIVLQSEARDDDSHMHTKITVFPFQSLLHSKGQKAESRELAREAQDADHVHLPDLGVSSGTKAAWELFFEKSDACRFLQIAMAAGIVQRWSDSPWRITSYAGSGGFADVYIAKGPQDKTAAAKLMRGSLTEKKVADANKSWAVFSREIQVLRSLQGSKSVPRIYGCFIMRIRDQGVVKTNLCMVMEYFETGLDTLRLNSTFTELQARPVLQDVLSGMKYMHAKFYAHRDIKMSNVMLMTADGPA